MANRVNWIKLEQAIRKHRLTIFSPLELERLLGISAIAARFLVHRYAQCRVLVKLRNGLYCLADHPPSELAMANRLYAPSYVSFEFALAYYHLIPESAYVVTSATSRPTRVLTALEKTFEYHRLKAAAFTGYTPTRVGADTVLLATPEKALVDTCYFVALGKKALNDRLELRTVRWPKIHAYARLFARPALLKLLRRLR